MQTQQPAEFGGYSRRREAIRIFERADPSGRLRDAQPLFRKLARCNVD